MGVSSFEIGKLDEQLSAYDIAWNSYKSIGQARLPGGLVAVFSQTNPQVFGPTNYIACNQETLIAVVERLDKVKTGELTLIFEDERVNLLHRAEKQHTVFATGATELEQALKKGEPVVSFEFEESFVRLLLAKTAPAPTA